MTPERARKREEDREGAGEKPPSGKTRLAHRRARQAPFLHSPLPLGPPRSNPVRSFPPFEPSGTHYLNITGLVLRMGFPDSLHFPTSPRLRYARTPVARDLRLRSYAGGSGSATFPSSRGICRIGSETVPLAICCP